MRLLFVILLVLAVVASHRLVKGAVLSEGYAVAIVIERFYVTDRFVRMYLDDTLIFEHPSQSQAEQSFNQIRRHVGVYRQLEVTHALFLHEVCDLILYLAVEEYGRSYLTGTAARRAQLLVVDLGLRTYPLTGDLHLDSGNTVWRARSEAIASRMA